MTAPSPAIDPTGGLLSSFREDEDRQRGLVTSVSQVVWRCDATGAAIDSTGWYDLTGESDADALGYGWVKCVHPDDVAVARDTWQQAVESRPVYHGEFRIRNAAGVYRWFRAHGIRVTDPGSGVREWIGVTWDIHDQHVAEDSLRKQNERLQAVITTQQEIAQAGMDGLEIMRRVAAQARAILRADAAAVAIPASGDEMEYPVVVGDVFVETPWRVPTSGSLTGWAFKRRESTRCDDALHDARVSMPVKLAMNMRSSLVVPLIYRDDCLGVLTVMSRAVGFFDDDDHQTVELLAGILASALASAAVFAERHRLLNERTDALEKVRSSEELFRALTEHADELVTLLDSAGAIRFTTRSAERVLGYAPEDLIGTHPIELVHPDDRRQLGHELAALAQPDGSAELSLRMRHKDGSWRQVEGSGRNLLHVPAVNGIVTNSRDVTARTNAEKALRFQAHLLDTVQQSVIATDRQGKVTYWNKFAEHLYGWTASDTLGRALSDFLVGPDLREQGEEIVRSVLAGESWTGDFRVMRRDGTSFVAHVTDSPIKDESGTVVGIIGISMDSTERRLLEEQLRQAQKMDAIGQLAGGVAHDFNNILTAITSYSDMLLMDLEPDHRARADVAEIRIAARRAAELTRQLLAFSRKQVIELQIFDATQVVGQMDRLLRRLIGENIMLETSYPERPLPVRADRVHLEQVIMNLAVNAKDAMPAGGKLRIVLETTELDSGHGQELAPGTYLTLRVTDTGCGMSDAVRARVFEPFFTTKPHGKGTGLGLAVVYGLVKQFGGDISVTSELAVGTEFTIHLPLARGELRAATGNPEKMVGGTEAILLVEDNAAVAMVARRVLLRSGYQVFAASSGAEALEIVGKGAIIDLVVTDVVMPEMSGPELASRLAAGGLQAPVVFMSGYAENTVLRREELPPGAVYLEKPWTPSSLASAVRQALDA